MSIRSKILLLGICTLVTVSVIYTISWSCGPMLTGDQGRFSIFRPDLATGSNLEPFYYTERFLNSNTPDPAGLDYLRNCEEWRTFTGNKAALNDIYIIQYNTAPDSFLNAYGSKNWNAFANNSFVQWMLKKANKESLQYMVMAKQIEQGQNARANLWKQGESLNDTVVSYDPLGPAGKAETKLPEFLKQRYAFQAIKLWYYLNISESKDKVIGTYEKYLKGRNTIVAHWGLVYYAMVQGNPIERTRYLLQAFDRTEEKKVFAYRHISVPDLIAFEKANTDTSLIPVAYAMKAIKNPGKALTEIQDVHRYAPNSPYLPLLVGREINKLEDWLLTPEVLGFSSRLKENEYYRQAAQSGDNSTTYTEYAQKNWAKDKTYLRDVRRFLQTMLENNYANKNFLRLAVAHLYHMEGNYNEAKSYLVDVDALNEKSWQTQLEIERLISLVHLNDIKEPETKEQIYAGLKRLEQQGLLPLKNERILEDGIPTKPDETKDDMSELLLLLSREFQRKGDIVTAGLLYQKADIVVNEYDGFETDSGFSYKQIAYFDRYAAPATIDSLIAFKKKLGKTEFEYYISPQNWAADEFYLDLKGTIIIREKKYYDALITYNAIPEQFWAENYEFKNYLPKKSILSAGSLLPVESGPKTIYPYPSKKLILEDIIRQQEALATTSDPAKKAGIYFLLGNAYYNISFHGKAWMMFSYGNSASEVYKNAEDSRWHNWAFFNFYPNSVKYGNSYYRLSEAMDMYYRAYNYAGANRELAAKSLLMLAYCDHLVNGDPYAEEKFNSKYLQILRANYGNTSAFQASKSYCPDVNSFINGN